MVKVASVNSKYWAFLNLVYNIVSLLFIDMLDIVSLLFVDMLDIPLPLMGISCMAAMPFIPPGMLADPRVVLSKLLYPLGA